MAEHIEAETKWQTFGRQHFQMHFLELKMYEFCLSFHWSLFPARAKFAAEKWCCVVLPHSVPHHWSRRYVSGTGVPAWAFRRRTRGPGHRRAARSGVQRRAPDGTAGCLSHRHPWEDLKHKHYTILTNINYQWNQFKIINSERYFEKFMCEFIISIVAIDDQAWLDSKMCTVRARWPQSLVVNTKDIANTS